MSPNTESPTKKDDVSPRRLYASALELAPNALDESRHVLANFGNMSSATIMFVLERLLATGTAGQRGAAMGFGPGLTAETMLFHVA